MRRSRVINSIGAVVTSLVLVIILISKFLEGAWIAIVAMIVLFALMRRIQKHYVEVRRELAPEPGGDEDMLPSRTHAVVLVARIHKATLRALAYARATRPSTLEAVTVSIDEESTAELQRQWEERHISVPLRILESPYRSMSQPVLDYIRSINRRSPRDLVIVFIPEYVVGRWWEQLLHNQSALRLKGRLLFTPGVMVTSVPYQLESSSASNVDDDQVPRPGSVRRAAHEPRPANKV